MYKIEMTNAAQKDAVKVERNHLKDKAAGIIATVRRNPYEPTQQFEKLTGNLKDMYSRRINLQNRFVYVILPNTENLKDADGKPYDGIVSIISMWGHY